MGFGNGVPDVSVTMIPFSGNDQQRRSGANIPAAPRAADQQTLLQSLGGISGLSSLGKMIAPAQQSGGSGYVDSGDWATNSRGGRVGGFAPGGAIRGLGMDIGRHAGLAAMPMPRRLDAGGSAGYATIPQGLTASVGGNPAMVQLQQSYTGLPTEQLQELVSRLPPNSPQGTLAKRALMQRQMTPQSAPGQASVPAGQPALPTAPQGGFGGAPQMFADGGEADYGDADTPLDFGPTLGAPPPIDYTTAPTLRMPRRQPDRLVGLGLRHRQRLPARNRDRPASSGTNQRQR